MYATYTAPAVAAVNAGALTQFASCMVGQKYNVQFPITGAIGSIVSFSTQAIDRIIITADKLADYIIHNTATGGEAVSVSGGGTNWSVIIYYAYNMIELKPTTADISATATPTITLGNFYAEQYKINPGVNYRMKVWVSGNVEREQFFNTVDCGPNTGISATITPNSGVEYGSFETYTIVINPYNHIRKEGMILIYFMNEHNPPQEGEITQMTRSGSNNKGIIRLTANCTTIGAFHCITLYNFLYDIHKDDDITLQFKMINRQPSGTAPPDQFRISTWWSYIDISDNTLPSPQYGIIDENLAIGGFSISLVASTPFHHLSHKISPSLKIFTQDCCNDYRHEGVFRFKLNFSYELNYDNSDTIVLSHFPFRFDEGSGEATTNGRMSLTDRVLLCHVWRSSDIWYVTSEVCSCTGSTPWGGSADCGTLTMLIPEETPLTATNDYVISIEYRGYKYRGGYFDS